MYTTTPVCGHSTKRNFNSASRSEPVSKQYRAHIIRTACEFMPNNAVIVLGSWKDRFPTHSYWAVVNLAEPLHKHIVLECIPMIPSQLSLQNFVNFSFKATRTLSRVHRGPSGHTMKRITTQDRLSGAYCTEEIYRLKVNNMVVAWLTSSDSWPLRGLRGWNRATSKLKKIKQIRFVRHIIIAVM